MTIDIESRQDGAVVRVAAANGSSLDLELRGSALDDARATVAADLREFKDQVQSRLRPDTRDARGAMRFLYGRMLLLAQQLVSDGNAGLADLSALFVGALPGWESDETIVPLIEVRGPGHLFPFELLPLLDLSRMGAVEDIERFARRFLGFSAAVRRIPGVGGGPIGSGERLHNDPKLPITFAWDANMPGAQEEREVFARLGAYIDLDGPWPSMTAKYDPEYLAAVLFDPTARFDGGSFGQVAQIRHFACHCDTGSASGADFELVLAEEGGSDRSITLAALNASWADLAYKHRQPDLSGHGADKVSRPLVFLNACGSAHMDHRQAYSWPVWFLNQGHRGVIGTETLVPDRVAAQYAERFYQGLLRGERLGNALVNARRQLLHEFGNPLGLLYVMYADPDVTVDNAIALEACNHGSAAD